MHYIVFDLEFNQDLPAVQESVDGGISSAQESTGDRKSTSQEKAENSTSTSSKKTENSTSTAQENVEDNTDAAPGKRMPFEILQIGALKLDQEFRTVDTFSRLVKPTLYPVVSPFITELTGITTDQVEGEAYFPEVYQDFIRFVGTGDSAFCVWGKSDVKELFRNVYYHDLDQRLLPKNYLNIQPYASLHLGFSMKRLLRLKHTVEALGIPLSYSFHDAIGDAYYTSEILKKIYQPSMQIKTYDPQQVVSRPRTPKQFIDYDQLLRQFEKMYSRELSEEEKAMIKLAYNMGKTRQFIKER